MRRLVIAVLTLAGISILGIVGITLFSGRIDVSPPELESSPLSLDRHTSSFLVPVSIAASRLALIIDEQMPTTLKGTQGLDIGGNVHGERLDYTIRRGTISAQAYNDRIHLSAPLSGRATARAKLCPFGRRLGCSDIQESADLGATVNVMLSNIYIDSDWEPHAELELDVNVSRAEVRLIGNLIPISFRGRLTEEINNALPSLTGEFTELLGEVNLEPMLESVWDSMHRTLKLSKDPDTWLTIEPDSLGVSSLTASSDLFSASIVLSSEMSIHFGAEPVPERRPMRREPIRPDAAPTFRLRVPIMIDLEDLAAELNACCSPISVSLDGDASITFSNLTLREHQGRLLLGAGFTMPGWWTPRGNVYVLATPVLDKNMLRLEEIEFTVESESVLTEVAAEVARSVIIEQLQNTLQIDLSSYYEDAKTSLDSTIDGLDPGQSLDLTVDVDSVKLIDVTAGDGKLAVVGDLTGTATIDVVGP